MANQKDVAAHLDLTPRRIHGLIKGGVLPASKGPAGYNIDACRLAYIRYLRGIASGQTRRVDEDSGLSDIQSSSAPLDYQTEFDKEKWREKKRENDIAEGLTAPVAVLSDALVKVANQAVPILDAIPLEMKRLNPKLTGHDIQTVKKAIARARNAIAAVKIEIEGED